MKRVITALTLLPLLVSLSAPASAAQVEVTEAWVKPTIPGTENGAGYMTVHNTGDLAVTVIGIRTDAARAAEVHRHIMTEDGMMRMTRVPKLVIAADETVTFEPGGYHVMFFGVKNPFKVGDTVDFEVLFEDADAVQVEAEVRQLVEPSNQES